MRLLTAEDIDLICEAHRLVEMPVDIATHLCKAQADLTRAETLKEVGNWLKKNYDRIILQDYQLFKQGKAPWEVP